MNTRHKPYNTKATWGHKLFRGYVRFLQNYIYFRKVYWINAKNIPYDAPVMLVSDHQNGLTDALALVTSVDHPLRKVRMIARADAFRPQFASSLRWMGILPAYRTSYSEASTVRNRSTFEESQGELITDGIVGIYPEAGHQDKRWLGRFSVGYLHILFEAARQTDFQKEMFVVPSCNHYSDYFNMREEMLIWYGEPLSAKPYYELYRKDPQEARIQFNEVIREKVSDLMLNITDLDNYDAIDYIRMSYGVEYARKQGYDPGKLPEKLLADKQLFAQLEKAKEEDKATVQQIYDDTMRLKEGTEALGIKDSDFDSSHSTPLMALWSIALLLLAPLFFVACIPNILIFYAPRLLTSKAKDRMLHGGINFGLSILVTMPVLYLITFALMWTFFSLPIALVHLLCLLPLGVFAFTYSRSCLLWKRLIRFRRLSRGGKLEELKALRKNIHDRLNKVLS